MHWSHASASRGCFPCAGKHSGGGGRYQECVVLSLVQHSASLVVAAVSMRNERRDPASRSRVNSGATLLSGPWLPDAHELHGEQDLADTEFWMQDWALAKQPGFGEACSPHWRRKHARLRLRPRTGWGLSQGRTEGPQDAESHRRRVAWKLLDAAGIQGPVGIDGTFHACRNLHPHTYATRYPAQVAGLILVDASTPLQDEDPVLGARMPHGSPPWMRLFLVKAVVALGMCRACRAAVPGICRDFPRRHRSCRMRISAIRALVRESARCCAFTSRARRRRT